MLLEGRAGLPANQVAGDRPSGVPLGHHLTKSQPVIHSLVWGYRCAC